MKLRTLLRAVLRRPNKKKDPSCSVILVAAGNASRMQGQDKILYPLGGVPVLIRSLRPFEASPLVQEIIVVTREDLLVPASQICRNAGLTKVKKVIVGGRTRTDSVWAGLGEIDPKSTLVAVHDGARPLVTLEIVEQAIRKADECGAAAPAVPVKDTIKIAENGYIKQTPARDSLYAVQTPQVFDADVIKGAIKKARDDGAVLTDDCSAVERLGLPVALTEGSEENIKLTTPADLTLGEAILEGREAW